MDEEIKIYDMDGGISWVAAKNPEDAMKAYAAFLGYDITKQDNENGLKNFNIDYPDIKNNIRELTVFEMDNLKFTEDVYHRDNDGDGYEEITSTFRQKLNEMIIREGWKFPCFFATSEY